VWLVAAIGAREMIGVDTDSAVTFPAELRTFVDEQLWTFAKTMPEWPHEYIVRDRVDETLFEGLVCHIRAHGREGRFYKRLLVYYEEAGMVYWTMGAPLHETTIVNRCDRTQTYEARLAAGTLPHQQRAADDVEARRVAAPELGPRFEEALLFAVRTHRGDVRKGAEGGTQIPYVAHLLSVCALVLEDGGDEDEAIAALLHDTLEDHPEGVTESDLARRFGPEVAELVVLCSDTPRGFRGGPKAEWHGRKTAYVERLREEEYPLCRVALADKLHNTRSIVLDQRRIGDEVWKRFNATKEDELRYHRDLVDAFRDAKAPDYLVSELDSLVKELEKSEGTARR
jgi:hypothetical protein